jgi:hypothetical protein
MFDKKLKKEIRKLSELQEAERKLLEVDIAALSERIGKLENPARTISAKCTIKEFEAGEYIPPDCFVVLHSDGKVYRAK